jgi:hypothetical protein
VTKNWKERRQPCIGRQLPGGYTQLRTRSDIGLAVKELRRKMAKPTRGDQATLKKLERYLLGVGRVISNFQRQ